MTNVADSKASVWLHEECVPHLLAAVCRIDGNGCTNNDHMIHLRAQRTAEGVALKRGWQTEADVRDVSKSLVERIVWMFFGKRIMVVRRLFLISEKERDMFLMSFYLRGISFFDLAFLKKTDLKNGVLSYHCRKISQLFNMEWTKEMHISIDKYPDNPTEYLMPIITNPEANPRSTYRNVGYNINHNLKTIAQMIGIKIPLTMYLSHYS